MDSSTAKSIASRTGIGYVRQLETRCLWVQAAANRGRLMLEKVRGDLNPTDVLTKPLAHDDMVTKLEVVRAMPTRRILHIVTLGFGLWSFAANAVGLGRGGGVGELTLYPNECQVHPEWRR